MTLSIKKQNIDFVIRIPYLFLFFQSDLWFCRNYDFKIMRFLKSCVCLRIGRRMTSCDNTPTAGFRVTWRQWVEKIKLWERSVRHSISVLVYILYGCVLHFLVLLCTYTVRYWWRGTLTSEMYAALIITPQYCADLCLVNYSLQASYSGDPDDWFITCGTPFSAHAGPWFVHVCYIQDGLSRLSPIYANSIELICFVV